MNLAPYMVPVQYAPPNWMGVLVFGIFAFGALTLFAGFAYEALALAFGWAPITPFVRYGIDHHHAIAVAATFGLAFFLGLLGGHFWR